MREDYYQKIVTFGKYEGMTLEEISEIDPNYILWLSEKCNNILIPRELIDSCMFSVEERDNENKKSIFD